MSDSKIDQNLSFSFSRANVLPDNLVITKEFQEAFDCIANTGASVYLTGKAGTGKSTFLAYLRKNLKKNVVVVAPTGVAAINIGGKTIHSFFRFPPNLMEAHLIEQDASQKGLFNKIEVLIIDEISMVRADLLDAIDLSLKMSRQDERPFGGVQMVFIGDLHQLPPVVIGKDLADYFEEHFGGPFFFNAKVFKKLNFKYIELTSVFRQKDSKFKEILDAIREDNISEEQIATLNIQYVSVPVYDTNSVRLTLCSTNKKAEAINLENMERLKSKVFSYRASIVGSFDEVYYPTDPTLQLKVGAQIMMLQNDLNKRWVNGTLGIVSKLDEKNVTVQIDGTRYMVPKYTWENISYEYNKETKKIESKVTGTFKQFPLKRAWAITIHKSQGQTFERVAIDLDKGAFAHGQSYVALSRCTSLQGISLNSKIKRRDFILDPKVMQFVKEKSKP